MSRPRGTYAPSAIFNWDAQRGQPGMEQGCRVPASPKRCVEYQKKGRAAVGRTGYRPTEGGMLRRLVKAKEAEGTGAAKTGKKQGPSVDLNSKRGCRGRSSIKRLEGHRPNEARRCPEGDRRGRGQLQGQKRAYTRPNRK